MLSNVFTNRYMLPLLFFCYTAHITFATSDIPLEPNHIPMNINDLELVDGDSSVENLAVAVENVNLLIDDSVPANPELIFQEKRAVLRAHYKDLFLQKHVGAENPEALYADRIAFLNLLNEEVRQVYATNVSHNNIQNVHCFDPLVSRRLGEFLSFANDFDFGKPLSSQAAIELAEQTENFPTKWKDRSGNLHDVLMPVCSGFGPQDAELFSRSITFAIELHQFNQYEMGYSLMNVNSDNYELSGGCLPGRRNRIFLAYLGMMDFLLDS